MSVKKEPRKHLFNTQGMIDCFDMIDISSVGMRDIIKGLDPEKGERKVQINIDSDYFSLCFDALKPIIHVKPEPMRLGGYRWWIVCPECGKNVRQVFISPPGIPERRLACRRCHGLRYRGYYKAKK